MLRCVHGYTSDNKKTFRAKGLISPYNHLGQNGYGRLSPHRPQYKRRTCTEKKLEKKWTVLFLTIPVTVSFARNWNCEKQNHPFVFSLYNAVTPSLSQNARMSTSWVIVILFQKWIGGQDGARGGDRDQRQTLKDPSLPDIWKFVHWFEPGPYWLEAFCEQN